MENEQNIGVFLQDIFNEIDSLEENELKELKEKFEKKYKVIIRKEKLKKLDNGK